MVRNILRYQLLLFNQGGVPLQIVFGLSLDGPAYPALPYDKEAVIGEVRCGPQGLLRLLEIRLGLSGIWDPTPYRVEIYRQRLLAADSEGRFFHKSLQVDSLAVAETLLRWRDNLILGGWDFQAADSTPGRLKDLAAVEHLTADQLPPVPWGFAKRMRAVIGALPSSHLDIARIKLVEESCLMGPPWNILLDKLGQSGVSIEEPMGFAIIACGDLAALQKSILQGGTAEATGDGTLVILQADTDTQAADHIAAWLANDLEPGRVLIIPPGDRTLTRVLSQYGSPALGIISYSAQRPILQILPLLIELLWEPLDPYRLMEFLTLPETPIPGWVARRLAAVVAATPGIGGETWRETIEELAAAAASGKEQNEQPERGTWIKELITAWLETPRYPHAPGAPREIVVNLARRVAQWAGTRSIEDEEKASQVMALSAQSAHLSRIVETLPETHITQPHLQKLVRMVQGEGQALGETEAAGHQPWIESPDALAGKAKEVIWWGFSNNNAPSVQRPPWTVKEKDFLASIEVHLPEPERDVARMVDGFIRPVFSAQERLVLIIPSLEGGKEANPHPLYDQLKAIFRDSLKNVEITASSWLNGNQKLPALITTGVIHRVLPGPQRFWQLKDGNALAPRDVESYTSLSDFFYSPFKWVLKYKAQVKQGAIQSISDTKKLMGDLAHRLFEKIFLPGENFRTWSREKMDRLVDETMIRLLAEEGAVFLLPGYEAERMSLLVRIKLAAWVMACHVRDNGWRVACTECHVEGTLGVQAMAGSIDLLLERDDGVQAIVDLKWGGSKYRREELATNRALQLALYAHMLRRTESWPHMAFFILYDAVLLAPDHQTFKNARVVTLPEGESFSSLIEEMKLTWKWRRSQLDAGIIEVPVEGTTPDPAFPLCEGCLLNQEDACSVDEFLALVGWTEGNHA